MLSKERKQEFAADMDNTSLVEKQINRSKKDKSVKETQRDNPELGIDRRRTRPKEAKAHDAVRKHKPDFSDKLKYYTPYAKETIQYAMGTSVKYGLQRAIAVLVAELLSGILDETKDIFTNGLKKNEESFSVALTRRADKVLKRVQQNFKKVISAFSEGFQSGFLSEIVTVICNFFTTTSRRMVRIIREGFFSILQALKILVSPPEGMTRLQAIDAASKLFATALITSGGILMEDVLEKHLASFLGPLAPYISLLVAGVLTGIGSAFIVYTLTRLDLFGVEAGYRRQRLFDDLDKRVEEALREAQNAEAIFAPPFT